MTLPYLDHRLETPLGAHISNWVDMRGRASSWWVSEAFEELKECAKLAAPPPSGGYRALDIPIIIHVAPARSPISNFGGP